ncbi:MAG: redoxin family protein [Myxococcota bacterium]|nr:redoxin family protein [Myxococcota bacterium]
MSEPKPPERARPRWRRWLLEIVIVIAIVLAIRGWQTRSVAGGPAPSIDAADLSGELVRDVAPRERPVLVHFLASWCGVCEAEEPNLVALARDHDVIAIATQSGDVDQVRAWIDDETDLGEVRVVADPRGTIAARWGVSAFPTSFYVDRSGGVRHVEVGYTTELGMRARMWLAGR